MSLSRRSSLRLLGGTATAALAPLLACRRRSLAERPADLRRLGLLQFVDAAPANAARDGFLAALARNGWRQGERLQLTMGEAEGRAARCRELAQQLVAADPDLVVAIGTPPLVALLAAAPRHLPVVFCYCSNPWGAGAGYSASQHLAHVTGTVTTTPVGEQLQLARQLLPGLSRVGVIYNPAEPNSSFEVELLAQAADQQRLQLLREAVNAVADLPEAFARLQAGGLQALIKVGDYVTLEGFQQLAARALKARLPLIGVDPADAAVAGCLAVVGWDPRRDGEWAGGLAAQVLRGRSPALIPIQQPGPAGLWLNVGTARRLGMVLPAELRERAQLVGR